MGPSGSSIANSSFPSSAMEKKHLSSIANDVLQKTSQELNISVEALIDEFDSMWNPELGDYSRKLVEFCSSNALSSICRAMKEKLSDGEFSRFTFNMMLAWDMPSSISGESFTESLPKEKEDNEMPIKITPDQDDTLLFYSDLLPLLVDDQPYVQENSFVWLGSILPLLADVVNSKFTFETLTTSTNSCLHFPAYDKFLKEIERCIEHLQKQKPPNGVELNDDEYILHIEGTSRSQRVVRHIGGTCWPGRLTLTNYALYFETSGVISYEDALKINLSEDIDQSVKPVATGPWGAAVYDRAIVYESSGISEPIVLEFPEMTTSTRRDHWLALIKEIILLHKFLLEFKIESATRSWEMHARTILGMIRLHASTRLLKTSLPIPTKFLIFSLMDELPKGRSVLEKLADSLKMVNSAHPCSASSVLRSLNMSLSSASYVKANGNYEDGKLICDQGNENTCLKSAIDQARVEAKEIEFAKATVDLKDEGISDSFYLLQEQLRPLEPTIRCLQEILTWGRPASALIFYAATLTVIYKEWIGKAMAFLLVWLVVKMLQMRHERVREENRKVIFDTRSDKTAIESVVSTQHGFKSIQDFAQQTNVVILKLRSIFASTATKHANEAMVAMIGLAILLSVIPLRIIIMAAAMFYFLIASKLRECKNGHPGSKWLKGWWDSIPVIPVQKID